MALWIFSHDVLCLGRDLAKYHYRRGAYVQAEKLFRDVMERYIRDHGTTYRYTLFSIKGLANAIDSQSNRQADAEPLYRQALGLSVTLMGPEHSYTIDVMRGRQCPPGVVQSQCRLQPRPCLQQTLHRVDRLLLMRLMQTLAWHLARLIDCGSLFQLSPVPHADLATCLEKLDKRDEAETLYRRLVELRTKTCMEIHALTAYALWCVCSAHEPAYDASISDARRHATLQIWMYHIRSHCLPIASVFIRPISI